MSFGNTFSDLHREVEKKTADAFNTLVHWGDWAYSPVELLQLRPSQLETLRSQRNDAMRKVEAHLADAVRILQRIDPAENRRGARRG
ncbi:hypothetical protein AB0E55_09455 [Amycolatopsis keratiniphila]|uniref:hypothetical protein n=1 Tax=Amycolatopsis keratiniphila TaxID=129921 RepID=UPI0033CB89E5